MDERVRIKVERQARIYHKLETSRDIFQKSRLDSVLVDAWQKAQNMEMENNDFKNRVEDLEKAVHVLKRKKKENKVLMEQVWGLEKELNAVKKRDDIWERRLAALDKLYKGRKES
jgi:predicted  nucleic acid-binding Zn-ribbon protein